MVSICFHSHKFFIDEFTKEVDRILIEPYI